MVSARLGSSSTTSTVARRDRGAGTRPGPLRGRWAGTGSPRPSGARAGLGGACRVWLFRHEEQRGRRARAAGVGQWSTRPILGELAAASSRTVTGCAGAAQRGRAVLDSGLTVGCGVHVGVGQRVGQESGLPRDPLPEDGSAVCGCGCRCGQGGRGMVGDRLGEALCAPPVCADLTGGGGGLRALGASRCLPGVPHEPVTGAGRRTSLVPARCREDRWSWGSGGPLEGGRHVSRPGEHHHREAPG